MEEFIKYPVTGLIVIIGWWVAHNYTSKRDTINKRRELTLQHLINAYNILTDDIAHREHSDERWKKLERIVSEIQLFGSPEQVKLAKLLANEVARREEFQLDPLINSLRRDLRKELKLKDIEGNVTWLRWAPYKKD